MIADSSALEKGTQAHVRIFARAAEPASRGRRSCKDLARALPWRQILPGLALVIAFAAVATGLGLGLTRGRGDLTGAGHGDDPVAQLSDVNASAFPSTYVGALHVCLTSSDLQETETHVDYDVIVIGAGAAGLAAATALQEAGLDVLVIEAQVSEGRRSVQRAQAAMSCHATENCAASVARLIAQEWVVLRIVA